MLVCSNSRGFNVVELLIKKGVNVNRRVPIRNTPLCNANGAGNAAVVELLIENKADMSYILELDDTLLHCAAEA